MGCVASVEEEEEK